MSITATISSTSGAESTPACSLALVGLFYGEHISRIEALGDGRTRFTQAERFSGILVHAFRTTLDKTELGFEANEHRTESTG